MRIILTNDVAGLGEEGDIKEVAPGYARNYLIPTGKAALHTPANVAMLESRRKQLEAKREERRRAALGAKARIEEEAFTLQVPAGRNGKLFGSVGAQNVVSLLGEHGISVERKKISIPGKTLKQTGNFKVEVRLYGDEVATMTLRLIPEDGSEPSQSEAERRTPSMPGPRAQQSTKAADADASQKEAADPAAASATPDAPEETDAATGADEDDAAED